MSRRRGSATALKMSEVVEARAIVKSIIFPYRNMSSGKIRRLENRYGRRSRQDMSPAQIRTGCACNPSGLYAWEACDRVLGKGYSSLAGDRVNHAAQSKGVCECVYGSGNCVAAAAGDFVDAGRTVAGQKRCGR